MSGKRITRRTTRTRPRGTEQLQATALTAKGNMRPDDGADAPTIQPCHVSQVHQQLLRALGDQPLQIGAQ